MAAKKTILLIFPKNNSRTYDDISGDSKFLMKKPGGMVNVSLATVAALTPAEFAVRIVDENIESIDYNEPYDLVGITGYSTQLHRAHEIAAEFSKRGVLVVCGGPSVSLSPERWRPFADVLIIGEAERIWPQFLTDYLLDSYQREYRETERFDLSISPIPDYGGYSRKSLKKYMMGIVQTSRGCPFDCEFCDVTVYVGRKMRYKPIENVIEEVAQLYKMRKSRFIFLADDNFSAGRSRAKKILIALRDWNWKQRKPVSFITQVSIDAAGDDEFLELAAEAGLTRVFIGIETPNISSLRESNKKQNIELKHPRFGRF